MGGVDWEYNGYGGDLYPEWQLDTDNARLAMDHMKIKTQACGVFKTEHRQMLLCMKACFEI